jgi:hypothetical protein
MHYWNAARITDQTRRSAGHAFQNGLPETIAKGWQHHDICVLVMLYEVCPR